MTHMNRILIALPILLLGSIFASAQGRYFTFQPLFGEDGYWDDPYNWRPVGGPPTRGDTAEIPIARTCRIRYNAEVRQLIVAGTLVINNTVLTMDPDGLGSTLTGQILALQNAELRLDSDLAINGTGRIAAALGNNWLSITGAAGRWLSFGDADDEPPRPLLEGGIKVRTNLRHGRFHVNDLYGPMEIGLAIGTGIEIQGKCDFTADPQGTIRFLQSTAGFTGSWKVQGGIIELVAQENTTGWANALHSVEVTSGTVELNNSFRTTGPLTFSGGKIRVAGGKSAVFTRP